MNHETPTNPHAPHAHPRVSAATWLWASAAVLAVLLFLQMSGPAARSRTLVREETVVPSPSGVSERGSASERSDDAAGIDVVRGWSFDPFMATPAYADVVAKVGDQTLLTFNGGSDDVLALLDSRSEQILTYRVRNQTNLELIGVYNLPELFIAGQRLGTGTGGRGGGR